MFERRTSLRRAAPIWIGLAVTAAVLVWLVVAHPWDPRLDADEAARQLVRDGGLGEPYRCKRDEADETVTYAIRESDYFCEPVRYDIGDVSFWIATDRNEITGVTQTAP